MEKKNRYTKVIAALAAALAMVIALVAVPNAPGAAADPAVHFESGLIEVGIIAVEYDGDPVLIGGGTMETFDWIITGGVEPIPGMEIHADVDEINEDHLVLSSIEVFLYNTGDCTVTFHGPLLFDSTDGTLYHGWFDKLELGGILYAPECDPFLQGLILFTIASDGVLALFELSPVVPLSTITVEDGSTMTMVGDDIDFDLELTADCTDQFLSTDPAEVAPWICPDWSGIEGLGSGIDVSADELIVDEGVDVTLGGSSGEIDIAIGSCTVTLDGPRVLPHDTGDTYQFDSEVVGAYSLAGCTILEQLLFTTQLGASPSSAPLVGDLVVTITT